MTQFEVTVHENLLPALFGQGDGLKNLMEQVLNQVLAAQVTQALQAIDATPSKLRLLL